MGYSQIQMRDKFNKLGSKSNAASQTITEIKEIEILNAVDLKESIPNNLRQDYTDLFTGDDAPIIDLIGNQIQKAKNQDLNIIDLGRLDLEKMFPNLGLSGEARLYYNRKTNQFLRK